MTVSSSPLLLALGLAPEESGLLALLPLVEVAWADDAVQPAERAYILACAEERLVMTEHAREVLEGWLTWRPSESTFAHGRAAVESWERGGHFPEHFDLRKLALGLARAAGGVMGVGSVDRREREVLERLAEVLDRGLSEAVTVMPADDEDLDDPDTDIGPLADWAPSEWRGPEAEPDTALLVRIDEEGAPKHVLTRDVRIGRSRACDLQLGADGQVSRTHCLVFSRGENWFIEDLGSANGTFVNGERVTTRRLVGGEQIRVGSAVFVYLAKEI